MFPCGLSLRRALTQRRDPHADPLNGALSQMLCHRSLPCIPLLNHYGLIRGDTHLPCSSCAAPHYPSDRQYHRCKTPHLNSVFLVAGQRLCWGIVEKSGGGEQLTGRQVELCAHVFFFFSGWKRLSVQTVAADQRLVLRSTSDKGFPMLCGYFDCGGFASEASLDCPSNVMWGNLDFFASFFFFFLVSSHRWRCVTDTRNRLGWNLRSFSLMCKSKNGRNLRFYFWPGFVIFSQGTLQLYLWSGWEIGCVDCSDAPGTERLPHWWHCGCATEMQTHTDW